MGKAMEVFPSVSLSLLSGHSSSHLLSFSLSFFPSVHPSFLSFSGTHEVSFLPLLTKMTTLLMMQRLKTTKTCEEMSGEMKRRQTWTLPPLPGAMMTTMTKMMVMKAGHRALAVFDRLVHPHMGSAGTAPGHGSPCGGGVYKPVPPATPACRYESRSDGRNINCLNSRMSADKDPQLDLETQRQTQKQLIKGEAAAVIILTINNHITLFCTIQKPNSYFLNVKN